MRECVTYRRGGAGGVRLCVLLKVRLFHDLSISQGGIVCFYLFCRNRRREAAKIPAAKVNHVIA